MKRAIFRILLLNLFVAPAAPLLPSARASEKRVPVVPEASAQTELVLKSISERYEKLRIWSAEFSHNNYSAALGTTKFSKGNFLFAFPNRFRFSLEGPSEVSDFISDGKQAWYVKFPKGRKEPALVQHFKDVEKLELDKYLILLRGLSSEKGGARPDPRKDFKLSSRVDEKTLTLVLEPLRSEDLARVELTFEQLKEFPDSALIADALGGESTIKLTQVTRLQSAAPDAFKPKYHKNSRVEVVSP